jgi:hypothetical protein
VKKHLLAYSGAFVLAVAACSQTGPGSDTPGTAGSSATGTAGTQGSAGTSGSAGNVGSTGSAGTVGSGGNPGTAGADSPGTAGQNGTAGTTGVAGTTGSGGTTGVGATGGSVSPTGGSGCLGTSCGGFGGSARGGNAGSVAGTTGGGGRGGTTSTAGTTGAAGRGGTTGSGGTGGGGTCPTIDQLIPSLDGYYWEVNPSGNTSLSGTNYPFGPPGGGCPTGANWDATGYVKTFPAFNVGGTPGQKYTINIAVRGVVGTRCYTGGTPGSTAAGSGTGQNNTWYAGGVQAGDSIWNTMELRVMPKVTGQANQNNSMYDIYYTNSFQNTGNNWCQKEATYETRFTASFPVMGGGTITPVVHDSNCRTLQNCGAVENQTTCDTTAARKIDMSGLNPAAPTSFTQPRTGTLSGTTYYLQWVWIDVTGVTCP